ncbi:hypothetical protein BDW69DRAFT_190330 [Aspergillus filifer]
MFFPDFQLKLIKRRRENKEDTDGLADGEYSEWKLFQILKRALDSDGDLPWEEAAQQLYELMPASDLKESHYNRRTDGLAYIVIQVVQCIPYNYPSQDRLLRIVQDLMTSDRFIYRKELTRWNKLNEIITESWIGNRYWDASGQEAGFKAHHYVDFHAFLARFMAWQASTGNSWHS